MEGKAVVVDWGGAVTKAGFAGDSEPITTVSTAVGQRRRADQALEAVTAPTVEESQGLASLRYASSASATVFDDLADILEHVFADKLRTNPEDHPLLFTLPVFSSARTRALLSQILFERLKVPAVAFQLQPVLALYASRKVTGVVLDCGDLRTQCVPVYDGFVVEDAMNVTDIGGRTVTQHLQLLLKKAGYSFHSSAEFELVRAIKEKLCYVTRDPTVSEDACAKATLAGQRDYTASYALPDGHVISLTAERFRAPELLFRPAVVGSEEPGVVELVHGCLGRCGLEMRTTLFNEVVLAGGSSKFAGFGERVMSGLAKLAPKDTKVRVLSSPDRHKAPWLGGSIFASLSTLQSHLFTRQQYEEERGKLPVAKALG